MAGITGYNWEQFVRPRKEPEFDIPWKDLPKDFQDKYLKDILAQNSSSAAMAEVAPWAMGIDMAANTILGAVQAHYQGKMINAQLDYMEHMKTLQTTGMNAEISHRSELLKAQKELTVLGYGTAERLAQIQSKKDVKLAEIASDTKKSLYNSQARQQLFLRTRFYGKPIATSGTALV